MQGQKKIRKMCCTPLSKQGHRVRFKVMLHGTIRNDYSAAQHSVAMLEQCCTYSKQCHNHVATLCCAKNRPCESPRVTSPLKGLYGTSLPNLPLNTCQAGHASWSRKLVTQAGHALHLLPFSKFHLPYWYLCPQL